MKPFFSIIIPAYNSAAWIHTGLDSIKNQTFTDYEIIVICDDCYDNTAEIARKYTDKVFEVKYHNCGKTRNIGLEHVSGQWILFMDDDDWWITDQAFQILYDNIIKEQEEFDILVFDFMIGLILQAKQSPYQLYFATWNKAWRYDYVKHMRFPELPYGDDVQFHKQAIKTGRIKFITDVLYYYNYPRSGSITDQIEKGILEPLC